MHSVLTAPLIVMITVEYELRQVCWASSLVNLLLPMQGDLGLTSATGRLLTFTISSNGKTWLLVKSVSIQLRINVWVAGNTIKS